MLKKNRILFPILILILVALGTKKVSAEAINVSLDYLSYNNDLECH